MSYCMKCGTRLDEKSSFCMQCGTPVSQVTNGVIPQEHVQQSDWAPSQPQMPYQPYYQQPTSLPGNGKALGALICGIAAIVLSPSMILGLILGIVAIVLAGFAIKTGCDGKAKAGRICGIVGIIFSLLIFIASVALSCAIIDYASDPNNLEALENYAYELEENESDVLDTLRTN